MKKHFLLPAIALMMLANTAKSQDINPIHVGLKAGANYNKLSLSAPKVNKYIFRRITSRLLPWRNIIDER
ncbi:hypothetical protein H9X96_01285 [Pedobacter sp. N36a]|uniref:hypothetical protein n=1 Tax=Pedobacter sp. N36a TaxID=2767996 RepID=UPI001656A494|nr:hypothetical protein [Pedobacter sp. N36a]MBC8984403.1 hypothetical protein [Pedobacter sp. N36a]